MHEKAIQKYLNFCYQRVKFFVDEQKTTIYDLTIATF